MKNVEVNIKINKKMKIYDVACRTLTYDYVEIDTVREKGSDKNLNLPQEAIESIESILLMLAPVEEAIREEYLMESYEIISLKGIPTKYIKR